MAVAYSSLIQAAAARYGVSPSLLTAVMAAESSGNPNAISSKGAQGLMQLMPATAAEYGVTNPFDPAQNIDAGAHYLSDLMNQYGDVGTALAAYNWGPGNVDSGKAIPSSVSSYVDSVLAQSGGAGVTPAAAAGNGTGPLVDLTGAAASTPTPQILSQIESMLPDLTAYGIDANTGLALFGLAAAGVIWALAS